jgi:tripeptide aminopeptidase
MKTVKKRFLKYVQIDTTADPNSTTFPSSMKQKDLSKILLQELQELGLEAEMDEWGYVFGTIPSNVNHKVPVVCFCSHVDTAPDVTGM